MQQKRKRKILWKLKTSWMNWEEKWENLNLSVVRLLRGYFSPQIIPTQLWNFSHQSRKQKDKSVKSIKKPIQAKDIVATYHLLSYLWQRRLFRTLLVRMVVVRLIYLTILEFLSVSKQYVISYWIMFCDDVTTKFVLSHQIFRPRWFFPWHCTKFDWKRCESKICCRVEGWFFPRFCLSVRNWLQKSRWFYWCERFGESI